VRGAFEYQGQKCSAASRAYVPASLWEAVREGLAAALAEIRTGDVCDFTNYLGAVIAATGGAVMAVSLWMCATAALTALILDIWMIRPEERYLAKVFGDSYAAYRARVRRWF